MNGRRFRITPVVSQRGPIGVSPRSASAAAAGTAAVAVVAALTLVGERKVGTLGLLTPLAVVAAVVLLQRPLLAMAVVLVPVILFEDQSVQIPLTHDLYKTFVKGFSPLDVLVLIAFLSVALDLVRRRQQPRLPPLLALPLALVVLGTASGLIVGHAHGIAVRHLLASIDGLVFLLVVPFMILNLDLGEQRMSRLLQFGVALAAFKAVEGLIVMAAGLSTDLETATSSTVQPTVTSITYYEPTANWLVMTALLGIAAAWLAGKRPPRWVLLSTPLLIASLVLSYRRSFWIGSALALLLVLVLESTPRKRVMLVAVAVLVGGSIFALSSLPFQSQQPVVERIQSLSPTKLQTNAADRYRLDERANVVAEIKSSPLAGLGIDVPWSASAAPLGEEHVDGRLYVHFAFLWWWLKLGIIGAVAYISILVSAAMLAWRVWHRHSQPLLRYFGLGSLCAVVGLLAIETTASFTGVDARFTVLFAAQLGMLAALAQHPAEPDPPPR